MQRLIVGDIHGCFAEFQELLDKAALSSGDEIVALGDIVDRGPDSVAVLDFFRTHANSRSLLGNHERKHIKSFQGLIQPALSQVLSRQQWGEAAYPGAVAFMQTFPLHLELDEAILVHGFYEPGVPLGQQDERIVAGVMSGERRLLSRCAQPWYELYAGPKPLVVGHRDYLGTGEPLIVRDRVYCVDTGCCRGGALTGLLLPRRVLVSVRSRANHWAAARHTYCAGRRSVAPAELVERAYAIIRQRYGQVVAALRAECEYDRLSAGLQARVFSAAVNSDPLGVYLQDMRKHRLSLEALQTRARTPHHLQRLARIAQQALETERDENSE